MCSYTEHLEMLVSSLNSFLMSYDDSGGTSLGESETIVSYNHVKQSVEGDALWLR